MPHPLSLDPASTLVVRKPQGMKFNGRMYPQGCPVVENGKCVIMGMGFRKLSSLYQNGYICYDTEVPASTEEPYDLGDEDSQPASESDPDEVVSEDPESEQSSQDAPEDDQEGDSEIDPAEDDDSSDEESSDSEQDSVENEDSQKSDAQKSLEEFANRRAQQRNGRRSRTVIKK